MGFSAFWDAEILVEANFSQLRIVDLVENASFLLMELSESLDVG